LSLLTLLGFPLLGFLVQLFFSGTPLLEVMASGRSLPEQILRGLIFGGIAAANALWLVRLDILKPVSGMFRDLLGHLDFKWIDIIFFSFCAGVGEELFFRGVLQQYWGIWITAIVFIFIHGYLSVTDWRITVYGLLMVVIVAGMGYLTNYYGIWAAATAHFVFDVAMFAWLLWYAPKEKTDLKDPS